MQDTGIRSMREDAGPGNTRRRLNLDSPLWMLLVAGLFLLAELTPSLLRLPLGADEITYIAQTSARVSQVMLPPVHGRGAGLLAAPVTLLTTSLIAMRLWMALLSGLGLFLAMLTWRGLRPAWILAVGGTILGSIAIAQVSGVQAMADWWVALGALAAAGLFLQAVTGKVRGKVVLPLLAADACFLVVLRPQDAAFVLAPMIAAALIVPAWRKPGVLVAFVAGIALGAAEWIAEAYRYYGGLIGRINLMNGEPPKFGVHFSLGYQLRVLNGPWYCPPGVCRGWEFPWMTVWWAAFLALAILGIVVARHFVRASSLLAVASAVSVLASYTLFLTYAAPRYLLPVYALLAIPAADAIGWLATESRWRKAGIVVACTFLAGGIVAHRFVLLKEVKVQTAQRAEFAEKAAFLHGLGIRRPCVVASPSVAYFADCAAPWTGETVHQALARTTFGNRGWRLIHTHGQPRVAYVRR